MKRPSFVSIILSFLLSVGILCDSAIAKTSPSSPVPSQKNGKKSSTIPLKGKSYYSYGKVKRRGYYSYNYAQGINTRKFTDPSLNGQNAFGPLESDFFFSTPRPQIGGVSPYMH